MPDIFYLFSKWWKQMLALVLVSVIIAGVIVFLMPQKYLSVATALPASSVSTDKARIFNNNIEYLYSSMGNPDDLDRVIGTAQLDTVYLALADEFNLWDHYKLEEKSKNFYRIKAARILKKNSSIIKSGYGELKIKVWDTDKSLGPQLANGIMDKLNMIHQNLQSESNQITLNELKTGKARLQQRLDSIHLTGNREHFSFSEQVLTDQLQQYEKLIGEYQLMVDSRPSVLMVVEKAKQEMKPDKPDWLLILVATGALAFFFSLLLALTLERRKKQA